MQDCCLCRATNPFSFQSTQFAAIALQADAYLQEKAKIKSWLQQFSAVLCIPHAIFINPIQQSTLLVFFKLKRLLRKPHILRCPKLSGK